LVVRVAQRVAEMGVVDHCVVATDSDEIASVVREHGGEAALTRADHPSGTDRVAEVAGRPEFSGYDVVVNVQGDEPFISDTVVAGIVDLIGMFELSTAAVRVPPPAAILDDPNVVKVIANDDGQAMYFSRAPIPFLRDARDASLRADQVWQHIGVYAYTPAAIARWVALPVHSLERIERLEQLRPLAAGLRMGVFVSDEPVRPGIDTEADLERANREWMDFSTR
jgi:3-deoxy-manno-octulosonate cytidylyltransferase (CMP-KDO synthetase)